MIISDTSCLIALEKIQKLDLLKELFQEVVVTEKVFEEYGKKLPNWIHVHEPFISDTIDELEKVLDRGEASSIALA